jgi:hypothetical protein
MQATAKKPWYRHPWPWILMSGPAIVVVAGIFTAYLAVTTADGLVADPPSREAARQRLTPEQRANLPAKGAMSAAP